MSRDVRFAVYVSAVAWLVLAALHVSGVVDVIARLESR